MASHMRQDLQSAVRQARQTAQFAEIQASQRKTTTQSMKKPTLVGYTKLAMKRAADTLHLWITTPTG